MKKIYFFIILLLTIYGGIAYWVFFRRPLFLSTASPNRTYRIDLKGIKSRPPVPVIYSIIGFDVFKNDGRIVKNAYAHSGDWFDISFELAYPEHIWVNEQVVRFGRDLGVAVDKPDKLSVINRSGNVIRYMRIRADDMFIVLDMPPGSRFELTSSRSGGSPKWIAAEGQFADGQSISNSGVNFPLRNTPDESLRYCLSVEAGGLRIESLQNEGYGDMADKPNIPKARSCEL